MKSQEMETTTTAGQTQQAFHEELKTLLLKYKAEMMIEDFGKGYNNDFQIVVDFQYSKTLGVIPQLKLGTYESGT